MHTAIDLRDVIQSEAKELPNVAQSLSYEIPRRKVVDTAKSDGAYASDETESCDLYAHPCAQGPES